MIGPFQAVLKKVIGNRNDAASASGSLHAKVADVKSSLKNSFAGTLTLSTITASQTWSTSEVSQSGPSISGGPGRIRSIYVTDIPPGLTLLIRIVFVIDGVVFSGFPGYGEGIVGGNQPLWCGYDGIFDQEKKLWLDIPFKSNVTSTIYYKVGGAGGSSGSYSKFTIEYEKY